MRLFTAILALILTGPLLASDEYSHRIWRIEDGLPSNRIQALAQTPDGYLWVATAGGLARFDGVRFTVFHAGNTPALRDDSILALSSTRDGSLWIGTEGGGLLRYKDGSFRAFGMAEGLTNGFVRAILEDKDGTIWVGTDRGFFRLVKDHLFRMDDTPEVPFASIIQVAADGAGQIWAATATGLLTVVNGKLVRVKCRGDLDNTEVRSLHQARDGTLWSIDTNGFSDIRDGCRIPRELGRDASISTLSEDQDGVLWMGTLGHGLVRYQAGKLERITAPSVLPGNTITAMFADREQNLWIGGEDGLLRLSKTAVTTIGVAEGIEDAHITSIYAGNEGIPWIATYTGQLYRIRGAKPERAHFASFDTNVLRPHTLLEDSRGTLWFGSGISGVTHLEKDKVERFTRGNGLRSDNIRQIFEDKDHKIWFATGSGLTMWDGHGLRTYYLPDGLSYPSVRCIAATREGDLLIGTDGGLNIMRDGQFVAQPWLKELRQEKIWSILPDAGGTLWLGTRGGGLIRVRSGVRTRYTVSEGLISNSIYQILDDGSGNLWMSSPAGVFSAQKRELDEAAAGGPSLIHAVPYGISDGMLTGQMSGGLQPAGARMPSGDLWFPSLKGVVRIEPAKISARPSMPVLIERVTDGDRHIATSGPIEIPAAHSKLQIDYTTCNLTAPQRVSFQYRLEGFEENWTQASRNRTAYYTNLPPGRYRFVVMATDASSLLHPSKASIDVVLLPSFYQTAYFYGLCAILAALAGFAGLRLYHRQTNSRYALRLEERTRLAREMHDTVIQGCVGVSTLLEAAGRVLYSEPAEAAGLLNHARAEIKETLEEARQAVWDLRNSMDGKSGISALADLAKKLGAENAIQVVCEISGSGAVVAPALDRTLLLVGREALRNSVLHGHPVHIALRIVVDTLNVTLELADDGKGFDPAPMRPNDSAHFGLIGMRERVERLGGTLLIDSAPGKGTHVSVSIPLACDEVGNPALQ